MHERRRHNLDARSAQLLRAVVITVFRREDDSGVSVGRAGKLAVGAEG
jgi:hypothetical protein